MPIPRLGMPVFTPTEPRARAIYTSGPSRARGSGVCCVVFTAGPVLTTYLCMDTTFFTWMVHSLGARVMC